MANDQQQGPPRRRDPGGPNMARGLVVWAIVMVAVVLLLSLSSYDPLSGRTQQISIKRFNEALDADTIKRARVQDGWIYGEMKAGGAVAKFKVYVGGRYLDFRKVDELSKKIDDFQIQPQSLMRNILLPMIPWVLMFVLLWFFLFRQMRGPGAGGILSFGKSQAKRITKSTGVTFDDVAGVEEAKEEVKELVEFLKNPEEFHRLGGRSPRGVMLVGPPGTGKTLLAKAIAGEAGVPFLSISGSDFVEMFVGVGASRVRDLFRQAKEESPCIIFLDEIDAVGRRRGSGLGGGHDEREQTLNAILVEMDGFERDTGVIVIAATNRPDVLDPALLRPGRFDRQVVVDLPDIKGREAILRVHGKKIKMAADIDYKVMARGTPMFSGADLEAVLNEAAIQATIKGKDAVEMEDFEEARDKIMWGKQKRSRVMTEEDRRMTAIHESGHAVVAYLHPHTEPIHKVTIIPRGMFLGATMFLPERDRYDIKRGEALGQMMMAMGGRIAEELFCNDIGSGAKNDLEQCTKLARKMVCDWGMSSLGFISYSDSEEHLFLGREIARHRTHSEATAIRIDEEVKKLIDSCYAEAKRMLEEHRKEAMAIAEALLRYESLDADEVDRLMHGAPVESLRGETPSSSEPGQDAAAESSESGENDQHADAENS